MAKFITYLPDRYLGCRDLRHAWTGPKWYREPDGTTIRITSCFRCWTERQEIVDLKTGDILSRTYRYPDGYQWERETVDEERPTARDYRVESAKRAKGKMTEIKDRSDIPHHINEEY